MISRRDFITSASAAACAAAVPMTAQTASSKPRPNILILITDEQSADSTSGRIGSRYVHTPNMDGLADRGRIFTRAYCANPICVPSRNSMFTGRYPTEIGIVDNSNLTTASLDPKRFPMMGKIFEREGYNGGYFGKWHLACSEDETNVHGFRTMATTINDDTAAAAAAVQFLQAKHDAPFLLVASFLNPHNICEWARGQRLPLGAIGMPPPVSQCPPMLANHGAQINEPDIMTLVRRSYQDSPMFPVGNFDEKQWREYRWAYYRLVEKTDEQIGIVLQALRKSGLEQETLVVLLSDHGDCQGAHGWNQKTVFYDESARVPLVMSYPDVITPGVSTRLVNTGIDLIPTLCHYAGFTPPATLPGLSLKDSGRDPRSYVVVSNKIVQGAPVNGHVPTPSGRMVRSLRYKYCAYDEGKQRESLVDMENDPGEMVNVAGESKVRDVLVQHRSMLAEWCSTTHNTFPIPTA